ncbi:hypothetical protein [Haladaptatus halobius]|uniref:hypothetical protein n=1 Tax=Haladaptatus halobius TaxID=2884875 RepID=UPI001D0A3AE8|nr:hypothetical protein [Haladaptatus halobius]
MTGLKSGSGDDLWDDESDETDAADEENGESESKTDPATDPNQSTTDEENERTEETSYVSTTNTMSEDDSASAPSTAPSTSSNSSKQQQSYIVRRAVHDKSVQYERDDRLTFFVHDDVVDGERDLITDVESELGRSIPKFDVREAVYRAALRNRDDILDELLKMGYTTDDSS